MTAVSRANCAVGEKGPGGRDEGMPREANVQRKASLFVAAGKRELSLLAEIDLLASVKSIL